MKKKLLSALLVFATIFAIVLPNNVQANTQNDFENIYLFSDNQEFFTYESQVINACGLNAHINNLTTDDPFSEFANNISSIADNSFVVVDIQKRFDVYIAQHANPNQFEDPFVNLENAFSTLKTNNCKIMFIDGTDEDTYQNSLSFLDYVDVHVNLDFMYMFVKGIITKLDEQLESGVDGYTIILDDLLCNSISYYDFIEMWLQPFIDFNYLVEYNLALDESTEGYNNIYEYLSSQNNINIYKQSNSETTEFYLHGQSQTVQIDSTMIENKFAHSDNIYMLGVASTSKYGKPWCSINNAIYQYIDNKLFTMVLINNPGNTSLLGLNHYHAIGGNIFAFFESASSLPGIYTLNNMITDFIQDQDMQKYNLLYDRRCSVTYMPITISPDGWIPMRMIKDYYQINH